MRDELVGGFSSSLPWLSFMFLCFSTASVGLLGDEMVFRCVFVRRACGIVGSGVRKARSGRARSTTRARADGRMQGTGRL